MTLTLRVDVSLPSWLKDNDIEKQWIVKDYFYIKTKDGNIYKIYCGDPHIDLHDIREDQCKWDEDHYWEVRSLDRCDQWCPCKHGDTDYHKPRDKDKPFQQVVDEMIMRNFEKVEEPIKEPSVDEDEDSATIKYLFTEEGVNRIKRKKTSLW